MPWKRSCRHQGRSSNHLPLSSRRIVCEYCVLILMFRATDICMLRKMEAATDSRCGGAGRPLTLGIGLAAVLIGAAPSLADDLPLRQITIDATVTVGALRPLSGIQAAAGLDGTALYKAAHIDLIRPDDVPASAAPESI